MHTHSCIILLAVVLSPLPRLHAADRWALPDGFLGIEPLTYVLRDEAVQTEIGVTDAQFENIKQINAEHNQFDEQLHQDVRRQTDLSNAEKGKILTDEMEKYRERIPQQLKAALRPAQYLRLQQVSFQMLLRDSVRLLLYEPVPKVLGLTPDELSIWTTVVAKEARRRTEAAKSNFETSRSKVWSMLAAQQRQRFDQVYGKVSADFDTLNLQEKGVFGFEPRLRILRFASVRHELEVNDDQYAELKKLLESQYQGYTAAKRKAVLNRRDAEAAANFKIEIVELHSQVPEQLPKILLPHQLRRLDQLVFQANVRREFHEPLRSPLVAKAIGMSKAEHQRVIAQMDKEARERQGKRDASRAEELRNCIEALTPQQQANFYRLIGKRFSFTRRK